VSEKSGLEIQSGHPRELNIYDEADSGCCRRVLEKSFGGLVESGIEACGSEEAPKGRQHAGIVLDDDHQRS
jgi:hypothetical protein